MNLDIFKPYLKKTFLFQFLMLLIVFLNGCASVPVSKKKWAEKTFKKLSIRQKIAQMMIYRMHLKYNKITPEKWNEIKSLLSNDGIGGIHIWSGDGSSSLAMLNEIQKRSKVPVIIDADIERGLGQRFSSGTDFPPLMAITATGIPNNAYEVGRIVAEESRAAGVQWNLSPVVDVNNNPLNPIINTRSFSESPDIVSEFSLEYIKGLQDHGMIATAKHFPGHGDTQTDSHSSLAMIPSDSSRLWSVELKPFVKVAKAGVDAIMIAHVHAPDFQPESDNPATLSKFWVTNILRKKIGFEGVIITDGMGMGGVTKNYADDYAIIETVKAGCDVIIQNYDIVGSIDAIEEAVLNGEINIESINSSVLKILKMKEKAGLHLNPFVDIESMMSMIGKKEHKEVSDRISSESITLLKDEQKLLPLSIDARDTLYVFDIYDQENKHSISSLTSNLIRERFPIRTIQIDESDKKYVLDAILRSIPKNSRILINAFVSPKEWKDRIFFPDNETYFVNELMKKSNRIILASLGTPYLLMDFPDVSTYICAYKGSFVMQNALFKALMGKENISGRLPVSIPNIFDIGSGVLLEKRTKPVEKNKFEPGKLLLRVRPKLVNADISMMSEAMNSAVVDSAWSGGVLLAAKDGNIFYHKGHGYHTYDKINDVNSSDIFDLASITKAVATTSAIMKLQDLNKIDISEPVIKYLPRFKGKNKKYFSQKSQITVKDLLSHVSGLPAFKQYYRKDKSKESLLTSIYNTDPVQNNRDTTIYSDVGAIILGDIVEKISGLNLDVFVDSMVFKPLGMNTTFYNPPDTKKHRIVPTEINSEGELIHGFVHDENAYSLGGVAGHAGLFSTAKDLAVFSQMMLNGGLYGWKRIFKTGTVNSFTSKAGILDNSSRLLGWDSPAGLASGGVYLSDSSFGHTGFTGTSIWIDPENGVIVVLLTNAVYPNRESKSPKYYDWRQKVHSSVYESLMFESKNTNLQLRPRWNNIKQ